MSGERTSYDGDLARLMSEARDLFKSANYSQAANKYLKAAEVQHETLGLEQARDLYNEAIQNFLRASEDYKEKKQYRTSAQNLYQIALIYKKLNDKENWSAAMRAVIDDLLAAAQDYLQLWNEYERAITLVSASCFLLFSLEDFSLAEQYYNQYIAQIQNDPGFTAAQQVLYAAGYAIKAVKDLDAKALLSAQQLVGSHLKPHLSQMMDASFVDAIDRSLDDVVRIFRSKIKLPKIIPELNFSRDLVLNEPSTLKVVLENEGEGDAFNIDFQLYIPDEVEILDGQKQFSVPELSSGQKHEHSLTFRCMSATGEVTHEVSGKLTFYDQLQTKQTMMIGPYDLIFREVSLSKELGGQLADFEARCNSYKESLKNSSILPDEVVEKTISLIRDIIRVAEEDIGKEEFKSVESSILSISKAFIFFDDITSPDFVQKIKEERGREIQEKIDAAVEKVKLELQEEFAKEKQELSTRHQEELTNLENELRQKFEEEKATIIEQTKAEVGETHKQEIEELMNELNSQHKKEIEELKLEAEEEKDRALAELRAQMEEEKKKALEEQESLLQEEFQKRLSQLQNSSKKKD